jgi:hypothetical protein
MRNVPSAVVTARPAGVAAPAIVTSMFAFGIAAFVAAFTATP